MKDLLNVCSRLGITLTVVQRPDGPKIRPEPQGLATPVILAKLREHKAELLKVLQGEQESRITELTERFRKGAAALFEAEQRGQIDEKYHRAFGKWMDIKVSLELALDQRGEPA